MNVKELNQQIRTMITTLIDAGWQRTKIFKIILGEAAQLARFLSKDENGNHKDFGIRPLQRIGQIKNYDLYLVYIPSEKTPESIQLINKLNHYNTEFVKDVQTAIEQYLINNVESTKRNRTSKSSISILVDDLIE